ncbi:MAG: hypothetical protein JNL74_12000 [Fibrobacteres bacterium]|nr:hypothetical protein [Fibrobacterota bacterium]
MGSFTRAECTFGYFKFESGNEAFDESILYWVGGEMKSTLTKMQYRDNVRDSVRRLHALMKAHTGGSWGKFLLSIEEDGRVSVKFDYTPRTEFTTD